MALMSFEGSVCDPESAMPGKVSATQILVLQTWAVLKLVRKASLCNGQQAVLRCIIGQSTENKGLKGQS